MAKLNELCIILNWWLTAVINITKRIRIFTWKIFTGVLVTSRTEVLMATRVICGYQLRPPYSQYFSGKSYRPPLIATFEPSTQQLGHSARLNQAWCASITVEWGMENVDSPGPGFFLVWSFFGSLRTKNTISKMSRGKNCTSFCFRAGSDFLWSVLTFTFQRSANARTISRLIASHVLLHVVKLVVNVYLQIPIPL